MERKDWKLDDFKILSELGTGAFGVVNKVSFGNDLFAMKTIKKNPIDSKEDLKNRTLNEISNIIEHKNICKLYGYFVSQNELTYYLVFELCGHSLYYYAYVSEEKVAFNKKVNILSQCADAIRALHSQNILHLDIKLENFLLCESTEESTKAVKLIDFGFSHKGAIEGKSVNAPKGTLDYMSPEMLTDIKIILTKATDCWAFGVLIYDFVNERAPFAHKYIEDTRINIREINWDKMISPYLYPLLENIFVLDVAKRWPIDNIYEYLIAIDSTLQQSP